MLTEWLTESIRLEPGMRVLDLGSGRGASSVFLAREFGVQVWSADLWFTPDERHRRADDAGVGDRVFALRADARALPFPASFFDVVTAIDSYPYFGTDDMYLPVVARVLRPGGHLGIAGSGLVRELDGQVPLALRRWWEPSLWCLHSAPWWQTHWARTGIVDVVAADAMPDGWRRWIDWLERVNPDNTVELDALRGDAGATMTYVRVVARRTTVAVEEPIATIPTDYAAVPIRPS